MKLDFTSAIDKLFERKCLGQKTGSGFYRYEQDKRGKPKKLSNPDMAEVLASVQSGKQTFSDEEIVNRMMTSMCLETVRCLEDNIVGSAIEADMGLILGIGFPAFRGGALRYIDSLGLNKFCAMAKELESLGPMYEITTELQRKADAGERYYG